MTAIEGAGRGRHGTTKRSYKDRSRRQVNDQAATDRMLASLSDANKEWITAAVERRRNQRIQPSSIRIQLNVWWQVDRLLGGIHFKEATIVDVRAVIEAMQQDKSDSTVKGYSVHLKAAWKEVLDVDQLPRSWNQELSVRTRRTSFLGHIITRDQLQALLDVALRMPDAYQSVQSHAILWTLWDSGFRASELLSLNLGDLHLEDLGVQLTLRPDAPDLKTGPRSIFVHECAPALRAWLAMHSMAGNPSAPLFLGHSRIRGTKGQWTAGSLQDSQGRMGYLALHKLVTNISLDAGLGSQLSSTTHLRPHDFRHTRATRAARKNWSEAKMRMFFGWSPGSDMPSRYSHLREDDLKEQVLRDAGLATQGTPSQADVADPSKLLAAALKQLMEQQE